MPFILEQRRLASPLQMVKNWSECAGSKHDTEDEALAELPWWEEYDKYYSLTGWEYRTRQVKK